MQPSRRFVILLVTGWALAAASAAGPPATQPRPDIPAGAKYTCPMPAHPDEQDPAQQGPYFSNEPGQCPRCGMALVPIDDAAWIKTQRSAAGGDVGYTCPEHQQVFSRTPGVCPRCGKPLQPFKMMYCCPDPAHASAVYTQAGKCPHDGRALVPFRGIWLSPDMAAQNVPPKPEIADRAAYRCPMHPLVHSDQPGHCTICGAKLEPTAEVTPEAPAAAPADAKYVCPMESCDYFSAEPGHCPTCGMRIKPIEEVPWAAKLPRAATTQPAADEYACPMHPRETSHGPGRCPVCGMQLVRVQDLPRPKTASEAVTVQMNHLLEHYLALQERFAADRTAGAAQQALGVVAAAEELDKLLGQPGLDLPPEFRAAVNKLRAAAVKLRGENLEESRVAFVDLSAALRTLVEHVRPSREKYATIYIFHCPMSKGDWLQDTKEMKNPYYGFQMLKCGEPVAQE